MTETLFIVQPYRSKPHRLVPLPAEVFDDETQARRTAARLARFRDGIVVLRQTVDYGRSCKGRPAAIAILGRVPDEWRGAAAA